MEQTQHGFVFMLSVKLSPMSLVSLAGKQECILVLQEFSTRVTDALVWHFVYLQQLNCWLADFWGQWRNTSTGSFGICFITSLVNGYGTIFLIIVNVFKGIDILEPGKGWKEKEAYISILILMGCVAVLLEAVIAQRY